jgi:catechol-2,3-dioxygenase
MAVRALLAPALEVPDQTVGERLYRSVGLVDDGGGLTVSPRRLGHILLFTRRVERQLDCDPRVLGLELSDRSQSIIAFLRCSTDHHNLALLAWREPGFHHASFELEG